ncbi:MAG TPA: hypothetical protein VGK20_03195 [Candidatus Binatia bacterium]
MFVVFARGSLLVTVAYVMFSGNPPLNPLKQMRLFAGLFLAPEAAAWCIARAFAGRLRVEDGALVLEQRERSTEIPVGAIAAIEPWRVPLPGPGLWLRLRSGRRFSLALQVADIVGLIDALGAAGASDEVREVLGTFAVRYANARYANRPGRLDNPVLKFVAFSLVPTLPVFRLHQYITYGGTFGEYYTFGLQAYLLAFAIWWVSWSIYLVMIAAVFRVALEAACMAGTLAAPSRAIAVRRSMEIVGKLAFFIGIPAWIILRLTA